MWNAIAEACRKTTAVVIALSTFVATAPIQSEAATAPAGTSTPIKHLVVIFQENVSFDHYFGTYPVALNPKGEPVFRAAADTPTVNGFSNALLNFNPNLNPFFSRGGKLLMFHGWADNQISPNNSVNYYESVRKAIGAASKDSLRLFMVPGMGHCGGGEGPNTFEMVTALEQWKEQGKAPVRIVASHSTGGKVDRTRPLCPYPQVAKYKGAGSIDDEANFVCELPSSAATK